MPTMRYLTVAQHDDPYAAPSSNSDADYTMDVELLCGVLRCMPESPSLESSVYYSP